MNFYPFHYFLLSMKDFCKDLILDPLVHNDLLELGYDKFAFSNDETFCERIFWLFFLILLMDE